MKTIAYFVSENIKTHQRFIYNQIVKISSYRSIVIGPFDDTNQTEFPFENYYNLNKIKDLENFFKEQEIIAIHAHHGKHGQEILPVCEKYNIPLIVSIRGRDGSDRPEIFRKNAKRYSSFIKHGAHFFPVCQYLAEGLRSLGIPDEKIHVLYGGIETDLFAYSTPILPKEGEIRVLSVGRLVDKKGFVTLINAFKRIYSQYPRARLHIIGTGEDEEKIKSVITEFNLKDVVILRGAMDSKQVSNELKKAHIFCLASQTGKTGDIEGIPNVLKEAMASGLPVVSTQHAGIPELIEHQRTGYLAPEKNDIELAKGIQFFLEHPEIWNNYTERARKVIEEKFDVNKQIIEQQRLYSLVNTTETKTETKTEAEMETKTETEMETKTEAEIETKTEQKTEQKAENEKKTETKTNISLNLIISIAANKSNGVITPTMAEAEMETKTEQKTEQKTENEKKKEQKTEMKTEEKKEKKKEQKTEMKTEEKKEKKKEQKTEQKAEQKAEQKTEQKTEQKKKTKTENEKEKKKKTEQKKKTKTKTEKEKKSKK
ncbi:glycosyltransferase [Peribacillus simplex]|uniref:glycosyltransferase n=1 Tax=Peribacillus simplex TaxID=1478 RepID=UPI0021A991D4|nr:glycosyltransferase [Peribacillus simplex]